jgi:hypothetical protein
MLYKTKRHRLRIVPVNIEAALARTSQAGTVTDFSQLQTTGAQRAKSPASEMGRRRRGLIMGCLAAEGKRRHETFAEAAQWGDEKES